MLSGPRLNALLLSSNSDEGNRISYGDEWVKGDLIYTGYGLRGNQQLKGVNRFVAENSRELFLIEYAGSERLLFHDRVTCVDRLGTRREVDRIREQRGRRRKETARGFQAYAFARHPGWQSMRGAA